MLDIIVPVSPRTNGCPGKPGAAQLLFPDLPSPAASPAKPQLTVEERRAREADRMVTIRLRMLVDRELEDRGITTPAAIGAALGMPPAEAVKLLIRHQRA